MADFDVVGMGVIVVDNLVILPEYPTNDTKVEMTDNFMQVGGLVPVALRTLSMLGSRTSFVGKIAKDANGAFLKEKLTADKVDTSCLLENYNKTRIASVWVDTKNQTRTITFSPRGDSLIKEEELDWAGLPTARHLHLGGHVHPTTGRFLDFYKRQGATVSMDFENLEPENIAAIPLLDVVIMPKNIADTVIGDFSLKEQAQMAKAKYPNAKLVVVTDGVNGSAGLGQDGLFTQPAFKIKACDTCGAGDVHSGAIVFGFVHGWDTPKILEFAAAVAAIKCQRYSNNNLPSYDEVLDFINSAK